MFRKILVQFFSFQLTYFTHWEFPKQPMNIMKPELNLPKTLHLSALLKIVECPNVTQCYKVKMTFLNPKLNQIRMEFANSLPLFGLKNLENVLGIVQLRVKHRQILCFSFVCNLTGNLSGLWYIYVKIPPELIKHS